jgi:TatD DNase family protein
MTTVVDTHCHLDMYEDPIAVVRRAAAADVGIVAVTESPAAFKNLRLRLGKSITNVTIALGAHPLKVGQLSEFQKALFLRLLPDAAFVGEVGLDFSNKGLASKRSQVAFFERLLSHPLAGQVPMTVHTRGASQTAVPMLIESAAKAVLHWYSGPGSLIDSALNAGLYFSVNPLMLKTKSGLRVLEAVPRNRLLLETDGPFVSVAGRPCEPIDTSLVSTALVTTWDVSAAEVRQQLSKNLVNLVASPTVSKRRLF